MIRNSPLSLWVIMSARTAKILLLTQLLLIPAAWHSTGQEEKPAPAPALQTVHLEPWTVTAQSFRVQNDPSGRPARTLFFGEVKVRGSFAGSIVEGKAGRANYHHLSRVLTLYFNAELERAGSRTVATDPKTQIIIKPDGDFEVLGPHRTEAVKKGE